jgi:hypothetical protein
LDMLRAGDLWKEEYYKMLKDSEQAYFQFLKELHKKPIKPINESQINIEFLE